jgi:hypothetical protein
MSYLYGDSTPSSLESNFIQFLSDALDVSVRLLLSGERMRQCTERIAALRERAGQEVRQLEALGDSVKRALEAAKRDAGGGDDKHTSNGVAHDATAPEAASITATCAIAIADHAAEAVAKQIAEVQAALAASVAVVDEEDALERLGCLKSLGTLLGTHDPPESTTSFRLTQQAGRYLCKRITRTPYGLEWVLEIDVDAPHPFSQVARVDKFLPQLEVSAPELGGWLRKEVRNRTHRLEKLYLVEMAFTPEGGALHLRSSVDEDASGFNAEVDEGGTRVRLHRVGGEQGEIIEPSEADAANLLALHAKLRALALAIPHGDAEARLEEAKLDDRPVAELRDPAIVVDRLVSAMTPIVSEIAQHSLSPTELVLKRLLGDNRREEIFVSKATLSEKLTALPESLRENFKPLQLHAVSLRPPPVSVPPVAAPTSMRVETAADGP